MAKSKQNRRKKADPISQALFDLRVEIIALNSADYAFLDVLRIARGLYKDEVTPEKLRYWMKRAGATVDEFDSALLNAATVCLVAVFAETMAGNQGKSLAKLPERRLIAKARRKLRGGKGVLSAVLPSSLTAQAIHEYIESVSGEPQHPNTLRYHGLYRGNRVYTESEALGIIAKVLRNEFNWQTLTIG